MMMILLTSFIIINDTAPEMTPSVDHFSRNSHAYQTKHALNTYAVYMRRVRSRLCLHT